MKWLLEYFNVHERSSRWKILEAPLYCWNIVRDLEHRDNEATNIFRYRPTKNRKRCRKQKWHDRSHAHSTKVAKTEKVDQETPSGSEYSRRVRCAKLHLMLLAHQAGEAKRMRKRGKYEGGLAKETASNENTEWECGQRRRTTSKKRTIFNPIDWTNGEGPIGRFTLWQWLFAVRVLCAIFAFCSGFLSIIWNILINHCGRNTNQSYFIWILFF